MAGNRELLTREELSERLTRKLQAVPDAEGSSISVQYSLREPDADGCNWDDIVLNVGAASKEYLYPHVVRIVGEAKKHFNVK
jgi:hypothetical protein